MNKKSLSMPKMIVPFLFCAATALAQYKLQPAGGPPSELSPAIAAALQKDGSKIVGDDGKVVCEMWMRTTLPSGPAAAETNVTLPAIPHGALLGAIRFSSPGLDRRGITLKPGVYTLRFSFYPPDGNHQGAAPQRDFLILSLAAEDKDPDSKPDFEALMNLSRKASGTPHPATLSFWKAEDDAKPGFEKSGDSDWVLQTRIGDTPVTIILIGQHAG
ncbi:MAG: hypothetical protein HY822_09335 [Acidobacteria bacterium]|nr:hypothetical protein [Acidobacteriota bacterium]